MLYLCQDRGGGGGVPTLEKNEENHFNYRDEEKKRAVRMGKLELHFLKWVQLRVD